MYTKIDEYCIKPDTIASIGEFSILWAMVEEKLFEKCCTAAKLKKTAFCLPEDFGQLESCATAIKERLLAYYNSVDEVDERLLFRERDKSFRSKIICFLKSEIGNSSEDIYAAVCICFRIRNNLLHGEKCFWLLNQQKGIVDACSSFLDKLLVCDVCVNEES